VTAMETILVANAGSSSVKFQLYGVQQAGDLERLVKGQMDGIGTQARLRASGSDGQSLIDRKYPREEIPDLQTGILKVGAWLRETQKVELIAVAHRVVHGGPEYAQPVLIDDAVLARLEKYVPLAPLHQPNNLAPIRSIRARSPELPQVACFDTAFHRGHSALADHYALPQSFHAEGVRRYGFHGLSYEFIASQLPKIAPQVAGGRVIVAHLGSGASMCAMAGGRSVESTMGFTALDGLPMGTRPGQLDPGVVLYLIEQKRMSGAEVQKLLYNECGLKGLSGVSNDVRELETSSDPKAAFALDYFAYRIGLNTGMLAAALGGIDAFVFTAGIGENSAVLRARIAEKLEWLGLGIDPKANAAHALRISPPKSRVPVLMVPTDEELMIARHTVALLSVAGTQSHKGVAAHT
jgi:acetate kinase